MKCFTPKALLSPSNVPILAKTSLKEKVKGWGDSPSTQVQIPGTYVKIQMLQQYL